MRLVPVNGKFIAELKTPRHTDFRRKGGKAPVKFNIKSTRVDRNGTGGNYINRLIIKLLWL